MKLLKALAAAAIMAVGTLTLTATTASAAPLTPPAIDRLAQDLNERAPLSNVHFRRRFGWHCGRARRARGWGLHYHYRRCGRRRYRQRFGPARRLRRGCFITRFGDIRCRF